MELRAPKTNIKVANTWSATLKTLQVVVVKKMISNFSFGGFLKSLVDLSFEKSLVMFPEHHQHTPKIGISTFNRTHRRVSRSLNERK